MPCCADSIVVSAKSGNVEEIKEAIYEMFSAGEIEQSDLLITNQRHLNCLTSAKQQLVRAKAECKNTTLDVISSALRQAWQTLGEITGTTADERIIDRIYSKFCLGK